MSPSSSQIPTTPQGGKPTPAGRKPSGSRQERCSNPGVGESGFVAGVNERHAETSPRYRVSRRLAAKDGPGPTTVDFYRQRIRELEKSERDLETALLETRAQQRSLMVTARRANKNITVVSDLLDELRASLDEQQYGWEKERYVLAQVLAQAPQPIRKTLEVIATSSRKNFETGRKSSESRDGASSNKLSNVKPHSNRQA